MWLCCAESLGDPWPRAPDTDANRHSCQHPRPTCGKEAGQPSSYRQTSRCQVFSSRAGYDFTAVVGRVLCPHMPTSHRWVSRLFPGLVRFKSIAHVIAIKDSVRFELRPVGRTVFTSPSSCGHAWNSCHRLSTCCRPCRLKKCEHRANFMSTPATPDRYCQTEVCNFPFCLCLPASLCWRVYKVIIGWRLGFLIVLIWRGNRDCVTCFQGRMSGRWREFEQGSRIFRLFLTFIIYYSFSSPMASILWSVPAILGQGTFTFITYHHYNRRSCVGCVIHRKLLKE